MFYFLLHNLGAERLVLRVELHLSNQAGRLGAALPDEEQVQANTQSSTPGSQNLTAADATCSGVCTVCILIKQYHKVLFEFVSYFGSEMLNE